MSEATAVPFDDFAPTSGRVSGPLGLVAMALVAVVGAFELRDGFPLPAVTGALFFGVVIWAAVVRPRVLLTEHDLVLRNMFQTVRIPLVAVHQVTIRQLFVVFAGDKRYVNASLGRSLREVARGGMEGARFSRKDQTKGKYVDHVEDRIRSRIDDECRAAGVKRRSSDQKQLQVDVRREPAWLEIGLFALTLVLFVGSFFL